jgi:CubicO group peptidase (beta-lactamase class C family)
VFNKSALAFTLLICGLFTTYPSRGYETSKVDALFSQWNTAMSPGCSVVVAKDGAIAYEHGYGVADLESLVPITPQTVFDIASMAKQFTGLGIAMLIEQHKLTPESDIRSILPEVPDFGTPIAIQQLLHHTSGLRDWPETLQLSGVNMAAPITLDMIVEMVRRQRELDFVPGTEFQYSNTGYNLLAAALAKVTGQPFHEWIQENIFTPLGMEHSSITYEPSAIVPKRAEPYALDEHKQYRRVVTQLAAQGSSSLLTTADDMGRWLLNFDTMRVGGANAIRMTWQAGSLLGGKSVDYGFGWFLGSYYGIPGVEHSGSWGGYVSDVVAVPEKRFAAAVLCNAQDVATHEIAVKISNIFMPEVPAAPQTPAAIRKPTGYKANRKTWDALVGTYRLGPRWLLTISRDKDRLMAQASREDKFEMDPVGKDIFFVPAYQSSVEFKREVSGEVLSLIYHGRVAPRVNMEAIPPDRLARYAGDYWSEEVRQVAHLEVRNGQLVVENGLRGWVHLIPVAPSQFDGDERPMTLDFGDTPNGSISEVKVSLRRVRNVRYSRVVLPKSP